MSGKMHGKLYHNTPAWVADGALFHIRVRVDDANAVPLTHEPLAEQLLNSVRFYEQKVRWYPHLFLLMPDRKGVLYSDESGAKGIVSGG